LSIEITLACGAYDRTLALRDGRVVPEGVKLNYLPLVPEEIFYRQLRFREFQVSEMSMANYMILQSRGDNPFVAIPVFPSRYFRHGFIWVNAAAGVERPEDLRGKRMGVPEYHMTATLWIRGFLEDEYGVRPQDMHWFEGGENQPGRPSRLDVSAPPGVTIEHIPSHRTLNEMLVSGEIDALMAARYPTAFAEGNPAVRRLFPNYAEVEREYHRRTRNFPIMHCIALRRDVYEAHPWLAASLYKAFQRAKEICLAEMQETSALPLMLPWLLEDLDRTRATIGPDFWPYGLEASRHDVETLARYAHAQGLTARALTAEELFAPNTLSESRV
jgi:4,5-dihydroxyphthalate decarboxylase